MYSINVRWLSRFIIGIADERLWHKVRTEHVECCNDKYNNGIYENDKWFGNETIVHIF